MTEGANVNPGGNVTTDVNIKRLGQQQKEILCHLYRNQDSLFQQVELIEAIYSEVTASRKASVSRSISTLEDHGVVRRRKKVLITPEDHALVSEPYYSSHRVRFGLTDKGIRFIESDVRFPEIARDEGEEVAE